MTGRKYPFNVPVELEGAKLPSGSLAPSNSKGDVMTFYSCSSVCEYVIFRCTCACTCSILIIIIILVIS